MKKTTCLILAVLMCVALVACAAPTAVAPAPADNPPEASGAADAPATSDVAPIEDLYVANPGAVLKVMLMPAGDMNADTTAAVTKAVNDRIAELGGDFTVELVWSGGAWAFNDLDIAVQVNDSIDIIPAHSWSGSTIYTTAAKAGTYIRLDDPAFNLLEKYGPDLYGKTSDAVVAAATIDGNQGKGIYGYIIEKDSVTQLGYLVNETALIEAGFTLADFEAVKNDISKWEPFFAAYKGGKYPLNIEPEVLDRTVNNIMYVSGTGPLGIAMASNPADTNVEIISRYETENYKSFISVMQGYYAAGYVDPDQSIPGETSASSFATRRNAGDYLISTCVYAPGCENTYDASADAALGKDVNIVWVPANVPVGTSETAQGSGLAVYAGSKSVIESVQFLNMLASDKVIGDLLSEGIEGTVTVEADGTKVFSDDASYGIVDGVMWRSGDRAGWNMWRYGVVGATSAATPLGDVEPNGLEWENFLKWNAEAVALDSTGWLFDVAPVKAAYDACYAAVDKYAIALGSGASADYDAFISELKAAGIDSVVAEAQAQYLAFEAAK
ncbi:MAG: DUF3502 domain-containing protein [Clostridia bacterium]|nr:DUF3502 domain-containing protein [Clostridia bacterium]